MFYVNLLKLVFYGGDKENRTLDLLLARQCALPSELRPHIFERQKSLKTKQYRLPMLLRKEVIQPHLPIRLPCYDFTPVIGFTFDSFLLTVR